MNEDELQRIVDAVNEVPLREPGWYTAREIAQRAGRSTDPTRRKLQQMALHLAARFRGESSQPLSDNGAHLREWESFRGDDEQSRRLRPPESIGREAPGG